MLWICANDDVPFSVGAERCPQCGGTEYREQGDEDGPVRSTLTGEPVEVVAEHGPELVDPPAGTVVAPNGGRSVSRKRDDKPDTAG